MNVEALKASFKEKALSFAKDNLKLEEKEFVNPWDDQDKASVLQQSRCFSETPVNPEKCLKLLTRILYLLQQGEQFTAAELTDLFFAVTKLFQAQNTRLRRIVYLVIKELEPSEAEVFICMACLSKDMNGKNDLFRANSIRVLSGILDPAMAAQIDRYLKTAIVDKNPFVASSALVCGIHLTKTVPEVVKRWVSEIQETVNSEHSMVQFHALALIYELKKTDRLALHKAVMGLAKSKLKSSMAECLLIRYASQALNAERDSQVEKTMITYLDSCLRHKSEMVTYEAARAFCQLAAQDTSQGAGSTVVMGYDIAHATTILQIFLTSPKPVIRFGAIKTLNALAQVRPQVAARCNSDMEPLLSDQNRNIATLALTTLLKTGHESNVEKLVKQITSFMSDISDAFKIEVVRAVKGLCLQYPSKYKTLMSFLSSNLREDGTSEFKRDLVDALILIIAQVPAARESGLLHLCEFIEDCEYPKLCTRILGFLGEEVPSTSQPAKYIRFVYNRLILEDSLVRAAAVDALAKIAMRCEGLRRDILVLLQFGANDNDDEVRDRIGLYSAVLKQCVEEGHEQAKVGFKPLMTAEMPFSMDALYDGLEAHLESEDRGQVFNVEGLPTDDAYKANVQAQAALQEKKKPCAAASGPAAAKPTGAPTASGAAAVAAEKEQKANTSAELMKALGELAQSEQVGALQHSCKPKHLTESEAEYTVQVIKHMFQNHVVLEFFVNNTVPGISLENIELQLTNLQPNWTEVGTSAIPKLALNEMGSAYVVLRKNTVDTAGVCTGNFGAGIKFIAKEDGDDLGDKDDYSVENLSISMGDYMNPKQLQQGQFRSTWEELAARGQKAEHKMQLNVKTLEQAAEAVITTLNMFPCDNTGKVETGVRGHTLLLSGTFVGGSMCLVKALVGSDPNHGILAKLTCHSMSTPVCESVVRALM